MSTLHTINKSSFSYNTLASCIRVCAKDDGILLLEDGVFGAIKGAPCAEELQRLISTGIKVYALSDDIKARGLSEKLQDNIALTDYNGFVQLSITHRSVQSWY